MGVVVLLSQIGLMHVRMRVFSSIVVGMGVVMLDMFVVVGGVRVRVGEFVVAVFVGVRFVVTAFMICHCRLLRCEIPAASIVQPSRRLGCRTVRMRLRCQGSGTRR